MPHQQALDFTALARSSDPATSHDAAASLNATEMEQFVLLTLQRCFPSGATSIQIAEALHTAPWSISPRIKPLRKKGFIRDSSRRLVGPSGRSSIVWELVIR